MSHQGLYWLGVPDPVITYDSWAFSGSTDSASLKLLLPVTHEPLVALQTQCPWDSVITCDSWTISGCTDSVSLNLLLPVTHEPSAAVLTQCPWSCYYLWLMSHQRLYWLSAPHPVITCDSWAISGCTDSVPLILLLPVTHEPSAAVLTQCPSSCYYLWLMSHQRLYRLSVPDPVITCDSWAISGCTDSVSLILLLPVTHEPSAAVQTQCPWSPHPANSQPSSII
jgi:ShK domain-like